MKKILIVDDNADISALLDTILKMNDYDVKSIVRASGIHNAIQEFEPDLILLDIALPDADGREVCKQLKQTKEFEKISIVLFSANSELGCDYAQWHADGYQEKPFELPELLNTVRHYL